MRTHKSRLSWLSGLIAVVVAFQATVPNVATAATDRPEMVTAEAEKAIENGLAYLARTQARDGSWRSRTGYGSYPTAMTSLAGMALLMGGNTPVEGKYAKNVRRAVDYLLSCANPNGLIARMGEEQRPMYGHGFGTMFLGEVYGMERSPTRQARIRKVLVKAIQLTARSQSAAGGWLYTPDSGGDEGSVTITQIQGLRACRNAGIKVPKTVIQRAAKYIENSANADGGIRYRASMGGGSRPPITAAAVATLYNAGEYENPVALKSLAYLKKYLKGQKGRSYGGHQYYMMLYAGQGMYLSSAENWKEYFPGTRDWLIKSQAGDGSWQGDGVGETYGTAVALMTMQLPYAHIPLLQR